jgi:hypothetical protein
MTKKYTVSGEEWSKAMPAFKGAEKDELLSVARDSIQNIHLCRQRILPEKYELMHCFMNPLCKNTCDETILASSQYPFSNTSILAIGNKIIVYWVNEKSIMNCMSNDNGVTWSEPCEYCFSDSSPLTCFVYSSNYENSPYELYLNEIPGIYTKEGYKLAYISDLTVTTNAFDFIQVLKDLQNCMEETKKRVTELEKQVAKTKSDNAINAGFKVHEENDASSPVMPGAGFKSITPEYLKKMSGK